MWFCCQLSRALFQEAGLLKCLNLLSKTRFHKNNKITDIKRPVVDFTLQSYSDNSVKLLSETCPRAG